MHTNLQILKGCQAGSLRLPLPSQSYFFVAFDKIILKLKTLISYFRFKVMILQSSNKVLKSLPAKKINFLIPLSLHPDGEDLWHFKVQS